MKRILGLMFLLATLAQAQSYKIAVIGLVHSHVWGHLARMASNQPAELAGIAEANPELVAEARKIAPDARYFSDYRQMLDEARPDIVWAFVENNRHLEIVRACAPRKIHVMFEKPLAATHREALAIERLARQHGIQVMTNYQMAWWPTQYAARQTAQSGELGRIWRIRGIVGHGGPGSSGVRNKYFFEWLTDPVRNGGGALVDFGCYNALWALWYLGRPAAVYAQANRLQPERFPRVEDHSTIVLTYADGVALLEGSWDLPRSFQDLEVFGRQGSLYVTRERVEVRRGKETTQAPVEALPPEHAEPIAYMVHCLRNRQPVEGMVGMPLNIQVMEILDAAKQSIRTGREVRLPAR